MSTTPKSVDRARTGNHIVVYMDNIAVGLIQNLRGSDDYGLEPVSGIGDIHVKEYVPTLARHQVSCGLVCIRGQELGFNDFIASNGSEAMRGITFDIVVYDREGGEDGDADLDLTYVASDPSKVGPDPTATTVVKVVKHYHDCSYGSGDFSVDAHRVLIRNATFMARSVSGHL